MPKEKVTATVNDALPEYLPTLAQDYLAHITFEKRLSKLTIKNYRRDLRDLAAFAESKKEPRRAVAINQISSNDIRRFLSSVHSKGMTPRAMARMLSGWRGYFKFLIKQNMVSANPCDGVRAPKAEKPLPQTLSIEESIRLVTFNDDTHEGIRDRAAFELLYSSGLRIAELVGLNLDSINFHNAEVRVLGKGSKARIIPVGKPALDAVTRWLNIRTTMPLLEPDALFIGRSGKRITATVFQKRIKQWAQKQGIDINVHPHMLRHSFASHMLQSSENLRAVQEMMGHVSIASTQVYTHLDFQHLSRVYDKAHPRAFKKTLLDKKTEEDV
jgi:integrase/recombinase XerC